MTTNSQRIGLLGGTFDPVHNAHLRLARVLQERLNLDAVRWLPAGSPWQKSSVGASPAQRLAMLRIALAAEGLAPDIDERELHREGPTYTVDSLREMRAEIGAQALLVLLVGADQLLGLQTWHEWRRLFDYASLAVVGRPAFDLRTHPLHPDVARLVYERQVSTADLPDALFESCGQVALIPADLGDTSSSRVRERLLQGDLDGVGDLVPSGVLEFIRDQNLYAP